MGVQFSLLGYIENNENVKWYVQTSYGAQT